MSRQYQPIWEALKIRGAVGVACTAEAAPRIKKAVIKEKYMDSDPKWRVRRLRISIKITGATAVIQFKTELALSALFDAALKVEE